MATNTNNTTQLNAVEFGRVLGLLEGITTQLALLQQQITSTTKDHEIRISSLEKYQATDSQPRLADKLADKIVWGTLSAVGAFLVAYFTFMPK